MRYLSPLLTCALVVGLAGGVAIDWPSTLGVTLAMSAAWVIAMLAFLRGYRALHVVAAAVFVVAAAWAHGGYAVDRALNSPLRVLLDQRLGGFAFDSTERRLEEPVIIEGRLRADAALTAEGAVIRLDARRVWLNAVGESVAGGISIGIGGEMHGNVASEWRAGRVIRAPVLLRRPARYMNEGLPDQERALARRGVSLVGTVKSAALVEVLEHGRWWEELAATVRARTRRAMARHVAAHSAQSAAIATAILIGDRAGLSTETELRLQEAGTYHVIAISGGNIAILAALLVGAMHLVGVHGRLAALVAIAALAAYAIIAAGGSSVLRASLMAIIYLAVRLIDQRTAPANAISITAAAALLANPLHVQDVGFWFTFGATIALVTAASLAGREASAPNEVTLGTLRTPRTLSARVSNSLMLVVVGTVCVELALAPIAASVFQRVTIAGLMLNFAALPAMSVTQIASMGTLGADLVGADGAAAWLGYGAHLGALALVESARLVDAAPWLTWRVPPPSALLIATYYVLLAASVVAARVQPRRSLLVMTPALGLFLWIITAPDARARQFGDGRLHVSMFDVGQGDSVLVTFPNGRRLLVDTGGIARGDFDIGDRVLGPALRAQRFLHLDYLAITHADADHVGGARSLLRDFATQEVWWGIPVANHAATEEVRREAVRQRSGWRTLQQGDHISVGGVDVLVRHPPPADWERQRVRNNDSLVMELRFGRVSVVLTGDIDRDVEHGLSSSMTPLPLVVLKVAHHGSVTSSAANFLSAVHPHVALIGVGRGNSFGHPAPYVMGRLHDAGAEVFRTDLDGQITVITDGETLWTRTYTGREHRVTWETAPRDLGHEGHEGR